MTNHCSCTPADIPSHVFRAYDIRGVVDKDLNEDFCRLLGRAYAQLARENGKNNIAVGYDARLSSPTYQKALMEGICSEGIDCTDIGLGSTPQLYYAVFMAGTGGGIQITGSHNPPDMNGFKICLGTETLSGEEIQDLKVRMTALCETKPSSLEPGRVLEKDVTPAYISELIENCRPYMGSRKLKVVADAGNGVGGLTGPEILRSLGVEVIELYCEPDGRFPNHHPDPSVVDNLKDLIASVKDNNADFGISWDGDADRIGVVDEKGGVVFGDMLLLIYGRSLLKTVPEASVIGDVKCSSLLFDTIRELGGNPIMWKTGHSLIKRKLRETGAELAGEMSGHIFFKHRYYGFDDAIYASARLCEILSACNGSFSNLLSGLPRLVSTPEIRVECPEKIKFKVVEEAAKILSRYEISNIDGARVHFENGWGLLRASNTQPVLVMRFEADSGEHLESYRSILEEAVDSAKQKLSGSL